MAHPADLISITRQAAILVGKAEALGVTLRISQAPLLPLAMGNTEHHIEVWPARHPVATVSQVLKLGPQTTRMMRGNL